MGLTHGRGPQENSTFRFSKTNGGSLFLSIPKTSPQSPLKLGADGRRGANPGPPCPSTKKEPDRGHKGDSNHPALSLDFPGWGETILSPQTMLLTGIHSESTFGLPDLVHF